MLRMSLHGRVQAGSIFDRCLRLVAKLNFIVRADGIELGHHRSGIVFHCIEQADIIIHSCLEMRMGMARDVGKFWNSLGRVIN